MAYKQSRNAVLNEDEHLGIRYLRFLRCVTYHLEENECFQAKLHSLDSGFKTEPNPEVANKKLLAALIRLESGKSYSNWTKIGQNVNHANVNGALFSNNKNYPLFKVFDRKVSLNIQSIEKKAEKITRQEVQKKFKKDYDEIASILDVLSPRASGLIIKKLSFVSHSLAFEPQVRVKSWVSTVDKLVRLNSRFESLAELQDLIGVRVVTIAEKDLLEVEKIISKAFAVVKIYRPDYIMNKDSIAKHIVVKLKNSESKHTILAEVQIMTLSQFMFTQISHKLQYKNAIKKKRGVGLNRLSALLDVVDSEIERCFDNSLT